jgi:hypothetical protein
MTTASDPYDLRAIAQSFQLPGDFAGGAPYGNGHINDTFAVTLNQGGTPVRYILQRINHRVFKDPVAVMRNIERVCGHLRRKLADAGATDVSRRTLTLVPTRAGASWHVDGAGRYWRGYVFVEKATSHDEIKTPRHAFEAARAFGAFQKQLADLPAPRLTDTIPNFHHTRSRFDTLLGVIEADSQNRAAAVKTEIAFALARESMVDVLLDAQAAGRLPERVTHNDTKLNNVLLDDATDEGLCVIDLDTVMPGLTLYDFGDMCRTATRPTPEDEQDLSRVGMRMDMYEALVRGYRSAAGSFLLPAEIGQLAFSAPLITFETGIRFLTDYLQGDVYFKTRRPGHNLDRCRVQFKMVESFERNRDAMERAAATA